MDKEIKIRKVFPKDFDPSEKIHKVKIDYSRKDNKKAIEEALEQEALDNQDLDWLA